MEPRYDVGGGTITTRDSLNNMDITKILSDFPVFDDKTLVYLDSAATTQKPRQVIDTISDFYSHSYANVHRGIYDLSTKATEAYHKARLKAQNFINADDWRSIIFTSGTTESINLVANSWGRKNLNHGDEIIITEMEHHSNIVPWQLIAKDTGAVIKYIPITKDGNLDFNKINDLFSNKTKIVSIIHQSNVFGTINSLKEIIAKARQVGAITLIDAAQSVPHSHIDVQEVDCDLLTFSGHKMLGPTGIGVLYGKIGALEHMDPFMGGGDMISSVTMSESTWNDLPYKFEAGTPKIAQAVGLGAAIDYINELGISNIEEYLQKIKDYALKCLSKVEGLTIYGHGGNTSGSVISFNLDGVHPHDLAQFLDQDNIAVRAGHHCAQPIMDKLKISATIRASFYIYNNLEEVDLLCNSLEKTAKFFRGN